MFQIESQDFYGSFKKRDSFPTDLEHDRMKVRATDAFMLPQGRVWSWLPEGTTFESEKET